MTPLDPSTPQPSGRDQMEIDVVHFDGEVVTDSPWRLPEPRKFEPSEPETPSWRENLRAFVERIGL